MAPEYKQRHLDILRRASSSSAPDNRVVAHNWLRRLADFLRYIRERRHVEHEDEPNELGMKILLGEYCWDEHCLVVRALRCERLAVSALSQSRKGAGVRIGSAGDRPTLLGGAGKVFVEEMLKGYSERGMLPETMFCLAVRAEGALVRQYDSRQLEKVRELCEAIVFAVVWGESVVVV